MESGAARNRHKDSGNTCHGPSSATLRAVTYEQLEVTLTKVTVVSQPPPKLAEIHDLAPQAPVLQVVKKFIYPCSVKSF